MTAMIGQLTMALMAPDKYMSSLYTYMMTNPQRDGKIEMGEREHGGGTIAPLFETEGARGRLAFKIFAASMLVGVILIWVYRAMHILDGDMSEKGRWVWIGLLAADVWYGFYWSLTVSTRWNPTYRRTFKDRLSSRHEDKLPAVDVYVCTADPKIEPPSLVISTVLSVMAYDYPAEKLSVYLSDDGGSDLTFYALWEASRFATTWIPFCKRFKVLARSPAAYFSGPVEDRNGSDNEWLAMRKLYREMENRIDTAVKLERIPGEIRKQHKGFSEWNPGATSRDHQAIVQILIDRREPDAVDVNGSALPTLVYVAREKRPQHFHNFKAGAMNTLIRVSSEISNGQIILNVDCDMYSNNPESIRDALCFFMDEEKGNTIGYVQLPQNFNNITKNDLYGNSLKLIETDLPGLDGSGGPLYIGSGCFHRRHTLLGNKYSERYKEEWKTGTSRNMKDSKSTMEERAQVLATCTFEQNTQWGKDVGLKYGCPVEDVITGLSIQCRGWKSVFFNPARIGFLGVAPMTLGQILVQNKRWSEGDLQILLSKYCPFVYGQGKIELALMMGYSIYCFWAVNSLPTLFYVVAPSLCLLNGIPLFPSVSSTWFLPFAYVIFPTIIYSIVEALWCGMTLKGWWNEQRMWMFKRTTSYLFAFIDTIFKLMGFSNSGFIITAKVADDDVSERYEREMMEFGASSSQMFTIISSLAVINCACLLGGVLRVAMAGNDGEGEAGRWLIQMLLCVLVVLLNFPVYNGMFFRKDKGRMPASVTLKGVAFGLGVCLMSVAVGMERA